MFEDSLVESAGKIKTKKGSTVFVSAIVHIVLVLDSDYRPADFYRTN